VTRKLRIALVVDPLTLETRGGGHAPPLAEALLARGHTVLGFGAPAGLIPGPEGEAAGQYDRATLQRFAPEVIVAYDALSPAAWMGARVARKTGAALLLVEAGIHRADVRLHQRFLQSVGERLWGGYVRETARAVVVLDPVARARALSQGFEDERVSLLPEGVDLQRFRPGQFSGEFNRHRIRGRILLSAGPIQLARGLELLVEAFARTVGQRDDWALVVVGDGPAAPRLRALADRLGIASRVHLLAREAARSDLPGMMSASTLFALPALDDSARGRQLPRAMATGLPCVVSDLTRLRYFAEHDGTGLLAAPGDLEAWTRALQRATGSPEARRRWGARARELAEERFAWSRVADDFEALCARCVEPAP